MSAVWDDGVRGTAVIVDCLAGAGDNAGFCTKFCFAGPGDIDILGAGDCSNLMLGLGAGEAEAVFDFLEGVWAIGRLG